MLQTRGNYTVFVASQRCQRNFCDGLEMKFTSPLGGIQQADVLETAAKSVIPCLYVRLVTTSAKIQVCVSLSPISTRSFNLR